MTDRFRTYDSECGVNGAGDRHHWPMAFGAPRRPNKKFTTVRRPVARGDEGPEIRKPGNGMLLSSSSSSSPSPSLSSLSSPSPSTSSAPSTHCYYEPFRRPNPNNVETCEAIEWEVMSKHFARWMIRLYIILCIPTTTVFRWLTTKMLCTVLVVGSKRFWHGRGRGLSMMSYSRLNVI